MPFETKLNIYPLAEASSMTYTRLKVAHFDVATDGDLLLCGDVSVPVAFQFSPIQINQTQLCQETTLLTLKLWEPQQIVSQIDRVPPLTM